MSICHLITTLSFALMIPTSHPFKPPKHNITSYYKIVNNVFLTNPENHTSYGIYVAGETTTVDIPNDVANVHDIVNWKVINVNKDRLMFVHNNKPQILIDQKTIRGMEYSGELSASTIAFGDNEVLHAPSIFNPELTEPSYEWNYLESLYFDVKSEKFSVIRSLPWHKNDDWKFIEEWNMTNDIRLDDKLYLLIKRSIWNEKAEKFTQDVSMARLCLEKGSELNLSPIDIHFTRPELQNRRMIEAIFKLRRIHFPVDHYNHQGSFRGSKLHSVSMDPNNKYDLFITFDTPYHDQMYIDLQMFNSHNEDMFNIVEGMCASCAETSQLSLLQYHLRSEASEYKKSIYQPCSSGKNFTPSFDATDRAQVSVEYKVSYERIHGNQSLTVKHQTVTFGLSFFFDILNPVSGALCDISSDYCPSIAAMEQKWKGLNFGAEQRPFGGFFITKKRYEIIFFNFNFICQESTDCIDCIMFGPYFDCVWSHEATTPLKCIYDDQPKHKTVLTVNHCFKIAYFSPSMFNSSVLQTLSIQLNTPLQMDNADPDNYCTNIRVNELYIQCSMNSFKSGGFNLEMNLMNDKFAGAKMISALSAEMVSIIYPESEHDYSSTIITSTTSIIIILSLCFCLFFTRSLVNRTSRLFSRYQGPRTGTSSKILIHPFQAVSESTLVDHKQRIALSTSYAKGINLLCFLFILGILPTLNAFTKAPFITWRTSEKPIILGGIHHNILIAMKSPCAKIRLDETKTTASPPCYFDYGIYSCTTPPVYNPHVHWLADFENFQKITNQVCTQTTQDMVYETLQQLCPRKPRKKRYFTLVVNKLYIGVSTILGVISQAIPAIDLHFNIQQDSDIDKIWVKLDNQFKNDKVIVEALSNLTENQEKIVNEMTNLKQRFDQYLKYSPLSILTNSKTMMELSAIKQKLEMIEPDIQKKRLNSNLLKMFNVKLPCGDSCPSDLARNFDCEFEDFGSETRKLKLTFESAVISKNNTIYKADPFRLNEYNGSHYCMKTYVLSMCFGVIQ